MKKVFRGGLTLVFLLALLASLTGALAAEPDLWPDEAEPVVSYGTAAREAALADEVAKPKVSKKAGTYTASVSVELTTATESAKIYYTTDGSTPTQKSKEYTKAISIKKNTTLKAVAVKSGETSTILTAEYKIRAANPKMNKVAGKYPDSVSVKLSSETASAKIYYTTDGSTPTNKSKLYSKAIKLTKTTTLKAVTIKSGMTKSKVVSVKYTVFKDTYTKREGYLACTKNEKKAYDAIHKGLSNRTAEIDMPVKIKIPAALRVMMRVYLDNPGLIVWGKTIDYYMDGDYLTTIMPQYTLSKSKYTSMKKELKSAAEKIANKARKGKSTAEQIKIIHDEIILGACYDYDALDELNAGGYVANAHSAYGVLVDKIGVCESYSRAFQYVCQMLNIPALSVVGDAGGNHMWNMVKIGDNWYHLDLTWDDPAFGKSDYIDYAYFLFSTSKMKETRTLSAVAKGNQGMNGILLNYFSIPKAPKNYNLDSLLDAA